MADALEDLMNKVRREAESNNGRNGDIKDIVMKRGGSLVCMED